MRIASVTRAAVSLALLAPASLLAQAREDAAVRGSVVTGQNQPVALAVVELWVRNAASPLRSAGSSPAGQFRLDSIPAGTYHLVIRSIGFAPGFTPDFTVTGAQVRDLGRIRLEQAAVQLSPIEVTVERPDVIFSPDRTGYLVEALTSSAGGVVTDVLRELPDLVVELDGTIRLRGNTPAIFLNGKPAPMDGVSLSVFLEQFPADRIERIEVLDHPPARYAAQGAAGIINIVLKQGVELGTSGSVSLAAGTSNQYTGSGRVTVQRGKLVGNGGFNGRWSDSRNSDFTLRENLVATPVTFLQQDARSNRSSQNGGASFDLRYNLSPKARLTGSFFGNLGWNDCDGSTATSQLDAAQLPTLVYDRLQRQDGSNGSADGRVGYTKIWEEDRHELEIELAAQANRDRNKTREEIAADSVFQGDELPPWLTDRESGSHSHNANLQLNYDRLWGKPGQLEMGASFRASSQTDDQSTRLFELPGATLPSQLDDRVITRNQHIGAAFLTVTRRMLRGKLGLSVGVRGEWVGDKVLLPETTLDRGETKLFPSANLSWRPQQRIQLRLGYSQRVNRPSVSILDPTDRSTDPLNRSVGNPDIKSSLTRSVTLGLSVGGKRGQFNVGPYWNRTTDGWERVTTVDPLGVSTSMWQNLTARTTLGTGATYAMPAYKGWNGRINLSLSRSTLTGSVVSQGLSDGKLRWSIGTNFQGPLVRGLLGQGTFGYEPGRDLAQGRTSGQWRADFGFRYRMMNNRTTIGVSLQDPFLLRRTTQQIRDPSVIQTASSRITQRSMQLNLSYAFGGRGTGGVPEPRKGP